MSHAGPLDGAWTLERGDLVRERGEQADGCTTYLVFKFQEYGCRPAVT